MGHLVELRVGARKTTLIMTKWNWKETLLKQVPSCSIEGCGGRKYLVKIPRLSWSACQLLITLL
jgi:hypothetical protein